MLHIDSLTYIVTIVFFVMWLVCAIIQQVYLIKSDEALESIGNILITLQDNKYCNTKT
ncbi:hypothetical protein CcNV_021 [Crangon crangon nudivirus]|uniref:Uncharacterized protein n=1 Tax=Crangon crangon nudivirus TaxID=2880838 RepID=A0AAE8Y035_9VIRU|nr:hypothetical protein QKT25_gp021 [Crangon crangon nudivirus]UBZ25505.1 hypothetical protein CcNV_021 [Crangon crangon nudivirus]